MPNLKDTKRRIVSVKNTQKITRAMKLVSSAKYARANRQLVNAHPYHEAYAKLLKTLLAEGEGLEGANLPLLQERPERKSLLVVLATDRGLCGGLNANLLKTCQAFLEKKAAAGVACELLLWGRRAILFGQKRKEPCLSFQNKVLEKPSYDFAVQAAKQLCELFSQEVYDRVYLGFSSFHNALTQSPSLRQVLPVPLPVSSRTPVSGAHKAEAQAQQVELTASAPQLIYEPAKLALLAGVLSKQVAAEIYHYMLHGAASEHAARMAAMDNATTNADEVIRTLTLTYNRARQAAITKELIEITSGAEAL